MGAEYLKTQSLKKSSSRFCLAHKPLPEIRLKKLSVSKNRPCINVIAFSLLFKGNLIFVPFLIQSPSPIESLRL